jgi:hypothetical protein
MGCAASEILNEGRFSKEAAVCLKPHANNVIVQCHTRVGCSHVCVPDSAGTSPVLRATVTARDS